MRNGFKIFDCANLGLNIHAKNLDYITFSDNIILLSDNELGMNKMFQGLEDALEIITLKIKTPKNKF